MVTAPVGGDQEVGGEASIGWLDQHMGLRLDTRTTHGIANHPAHSVTCCLVDQALARFQHDVTDAASSSIEPIECAIGKWIDLDGIAIIFMGGFAGCSPVGDNHALNW